MQNEFDIVLQQRPDLTREDLYDIINIMDINDTLLDAANKYYPLNQKAGECGTI